MRRLSTANKSECGQKKVWTFLFLLPAIIGITLCLYFISEVRHAPNTTAHGHFPARGNAVLGHLPNMAEDKIREQMQKEADETLFSFKINSRPVFKDGGSEGTLRIENPQHNTYPFVVEIFLNQTGEKVYDSGGILPNHHIATAKLMTALPKGTHMATAYINVYDPKTEVFCGRAAAELTLIIKE